VVFDVTDRVEGAILDASEREPLDGVCSGESGDVGDMGDLMGAFPFVDEGVST